MKKIIKQLKQPNRFTHEFLKKKSASDSESEPKEEQPDPNKHKQIEKEKYVRKVINKPNEPSALRLEQINQTFNKLSQKSIDFIEGLQIDHGLLKELKDLKEKFTCSCNKKIKFYCLKCNQKCKLLDLPPIELPLQLHIVHHLSQKINKSSVAPMRFLTKQVNFYPFMSKENDKEGWNTKEVFSKLPNHSETTYILYPHKNSKPLSQVTGEIKNLIVLDCTWFQTDQIIESLEEMGYDQFIKLEGYESVFWRYNHYGEEALSSAESVMHFFREYQTQRGDNARYFDPLMLLYALNMQMVGKSMEN